MSFVSVSCGIAVCSASYVSNALLFVLSFCLRVLLFHSYVFASICCHLLLIVMDLASDVSFLGYYDLSVNVLVSFLVLIV